MKYQFWKCMHISICVYLKGFIFATALKIHMSMHTQTALEKYGGYKMRLRGEMPIKVQFFISCAQFPTHISQNVT